MKKLATLLGAMLIANASAELKTASFTPAEKSKDGISALIGVSGGNSLIANDGTIFTNLRIGLQLNSLMATGVFASFIASDVQCYTPKGDLLINYNAYGGFIELFPLYIGDFSVSVPMEFAGGVINVMGRNDESFSPEDYFFMADMAVQFNYRVTKMLEVSLGGGYRLFAGVSKNDLDDMDFNTPFAELRFTIKE